MSNTPLPEPYGRVTVHAVTGQHFFYRDPEPPYMDTAKQCIVVYSSDDIHAHAAAVSDERDAAIAALRERLQKMSDTMKGMDAHEAGLAEAQAYLMERVRVLEDALNKIAKSSPQEDGCYYTNRRNIGTARAALGDKNG